MIFLCKLVLLSICIDRWQNMNLPRIIFLDQMISAKVISMQRENSDSIIYTRINYWIII